MRRSGLRTAVALAILAVASACTRGTGISEGTLAPDFVLPRLDGTVQKLSNYRGKIVVVNLWATWCPPCLEEMPLLEQMARQYGPQGLVVLGIAADEDRTAVERFLERRPLSFEILLDPGGEVGTRYGITGYPETFVVDREGRFQVKFIGPLPASEGRPGPEVAARIEALLGG